MREFISAIEFLRTFQVQRGKILLDSVLDDGSGLNAEFVANVDEAMLRVSDSAIGEVIFTSSRTTWNRIGETPLVDEQANNLALLGRLRSGISPKIDWLANAIQLAQTSNEAIEPALERLRTLRNSFTALVIPGVSWFNAELQKSPFPNIAFDELTGHVSLRNIAVDVSENFLGFEISILGARATSLRIQAGESSDPNVPPLLDFEFDQADLQIDAEFVAGLQSDPQTSALALTSADVHFRSFSFRSDRADARLFSSSDGAISNNPDPLRLELDDFSMTGADLLLHTQSKTGESASKHGFGGPIRLHSTRASATKRKVELSNSDSISGNRGNPVRGVLSNLSADLFVDTDGVANSNPDLRLRGMFECSSVEIDVKLQSSNANFNGITGKAILTHGRIERDGWSSEVRASVQVDDATIAIGSPRSNERIQVNDATIDGLITFQTQSPTIHANYLRVDARGGQLDLVHPDINNDSAVSKHSKSNAPAPFSLSFPSGLELSLTDYRNASARGDETVIGLGNLSSRSVRTRRRLDTLRADNLILAEVGLSSDGMSASFRVGGLSSRVVGQFVLDRTAVQIGGIAAIDFDQYDGVSNVVGIEPINEGDSYVISNALLSFGDDRSEFGAAGISQRFRSAQIEMGGGASLVVRDSPNNRIRVNAFPDRGRSGLVAQFKIDTADLILPEGDPVEMSSIGFDLYLETFAQDLPTELRSILFRALLRFALLSRIDETTLRWPSRTVQIGVSVGDVIDVLRQIASLLNTPIDLGGVERVLSGVADLLDRVLSLFDEIRDVGYGVYVETRETEAEIYSGNLPEPIAPNSSNQIMFRIGVGTRRIRAYVRYKYPKVVWEGINSRIEWKDGEEKTPWVSIFFEMSIFVRVSFRFDTIERKVSISDIEVWLLQSNGNNATAATETLLQFLGSVMGLDELKKEIIRQVNARLDQQEQLRLPDNWDIDAARIKVTNNGVALFAQAMITEWTEIP